jgi:hypothetical protein
MRKVYFDAELLEVLSVCNEATLNSTHPYRSIATKHRYSENQNYHSVRKYKCNNNILGFRHLQSHS